MVMPLPPVVRLGGEPARARAQNLRVVMSDCDGVLTDGRVYVSASGETSKAFSLRDGMGVERLREQRISTVIVTRERSPIVEQRARKLGIRLFQGVRDKLALLPVICAELEVTLGGLGYIGDDVNDLSIMQAIAPEGLIAAPADAEPAVISAVHFVTGRPGGHGAFRDFAEWILALRGPQAKDNQE